MELPLVRRADAFLGLTITPSLIGRTLAVGVLTTLGFHYLSKGKREADVSRMLQGVLLIVVGLFLCF